MKILATIKSVWTWNDQKIHSKSNCYESKVCLVLLTLLWGVTSLPLWIYGVCLVSIYPITQCSANTYCLSLCLRFRSSIPEKENFTVLLLSSSPCIKLVGCRAASLQESLSSPFGDGKDSLGLVPYSSLDPIRGNNKKQQLAIYLSCLYAMKWSKTWDGHRGEGLPFCCQKSWDQLEGRSHRRAELPPECGSSKNEVKLQTTRLRDSSLGKNACMKAQGLRSGSPECVQ